MKIFGTVQEEKVARAWLHDVLLAAELHKHNKRGAPMVFDPAFVEAAKAVGEELIHRKFRNVDPQINYLATYSFNGSLEPGVEDIRQATPQQIATYIVYMAQQVGALWDFTNNVDYMDFGETLLGAAVFRYRQYLWMRDRCSGILHPEEKPIYKITGLIPALRICVAAQFDPVTLWGETEDTNRVKVQSVGGNPEKCVCYFFTREDAQAFLDKLVAAGRAERVEQLQVVEQGWVDSDGYVLFDTEFGQCAAQKRHLKDAWHYRIDHFKNGNPARHLTLEQLESFLLSD